MRPILAAAPCLALALALASAAAAEHGSRYTFGFVEVPFASSDSGTLAEGGSRTVEATLPANLTRVAARLSWTDDQGAADTFRLVVEGPVAADRAEGAAGELALEFALAEMPSGPAVVEAASEPAAAASLPADAAHAGVWRFTVELVEAGDETVGPVVVDPDSSNSWRLDLAARSWSARLDASVPLAHAGGNASEPPEAEPVAPPPSPELPWDWLGVGGLGVLVAGLWGTTASLARRK